MNTTADLCRGSHRAGLTPGATKTGLPHGTYEQVAAWLDADPRAGLVVRIVYEADGSVAFTAASGNVLLLAADAFRARYQRVIGEPRRPEQIPPERPPTSYDELVDMRLGGW